MGQRQPEWYAAPRILEIAEHWASGNTVRQISNEQGWPSWRVVQGLRMFWRAYDEPYFDLFPEQVRSALTFHDGEIRVAYPERLPIADRKRIALEIIARERNPELRPLLRRLFPWRDQAVMRR